MKIIFFFLNEGLTILTFCNKYEKNEPMGGGPKIIVADKIIKFIFIIEV